MINLKNQYKLTNKYIKDNIKKIYIILLIIFVLLSTLSAVLFYANGKVARELITDFVSDSKGLMTDSGEIKVWSLIFSNIKSNLLYILLGFIPFLFLPLIMLIINSIPLGASLGFIAYVKEISILKVFIFLILPHGIFEIPALILSITLGFYLCKKINSKFIHKDKNISIKECIKNIFRIFIVLILPLLILSGIIETFVTQGILIDLVKNL